MSKCKNCGELPFLSMQCSDCGLAFCDECAGCAPDGLTRIICPSCGGIGKIDKNYHWSENYTNNNSVGSESKKTKDWWNNEHRRNWGGNGYKIN